MKPSAVPLKKMPPIDLAVALAATAVWIVLSAVFASHVGGLWRDEVNSVNTARAAGLGELWRLEEFESSPLLWLMLLKVWISVGLGNNDLGLRVFGVIGGLTLPTAVWFAARRLGHRAPILSLAFLAINPEVIRWATSVRAWGLGAALAVVAVVMMIDNARTPSRRTLVVALLAAIAGVQCVYQNIAFVSAAAIAAAVVAARRDGWKAAVPSLGIGMAAALSLLPYLDLMTRRGQWNPLIHVPLTLPDLADRASVLFGSSGGVVLCGWLAFATAAALIGGIRLTGFAITLVASIVTLAALYLSFKYPTQSWYYLGLAAVVAVTAEAALLAAPTRARRMPMSVAATIVLVAGFQTAWIRVQEPSTNMDVVVTRLSAEVAPGDVILVNPWGFAITFEHYYRGGGTVISIPPIEDNRVHRYDLIKAQMLLSDAIASVRPRVQQALESGHHVWVVGALEALPDGATLTALPPPPLPESGWNLLPYENWWSLQVGAFLQQHAVSGRRVVLERAGGPVEDASLVMLSGWRDAPQRTR